MFDSHLPTLENQSQPTTGMLVPTAGACESASAWQARCRGFFETHAAHHRIACCYCSAPTRFPWFFSKRNTSPKDWYQTDCQILPPADTSYFNSQMFSHERFNQGSSKSKGAPFLPVANSGNIFPRCVFCSPTVWAPTVLASFGPTTKSWRRVKHYYLRSMPTSRRYYYKSTQTVRPRLIHSPNEVSLNTIKHKHRPGSTPSLTRLDCNLHTIFCSNTSHKSCFHLYPLFPPRRWTELLEG